MFSIFVVPVTFLKVVLRISGLSLLFETIHGTAVANENSPITFYQKIIASYLYPSPLATHNIKWAQTYKK